MKTIFKDVSKKDDVINTIPELINPEKVIYIFTKISESEEHLYDKYEVIDIEDLITRNDFNVFYERYIYLRKIKKNVTKIF